MIVTLDFPRPSTLRDVPNYMIFVATASCTTGLTLPYPDGDCTAYYRPVVILESAKPGTLPSKNAVRIVDEIVIKD